MKKQLKDGRWIMASYDDVKEFFKSNFIIGKKIKSILPKAFDYMNHNLSEIEDIYSHDAWSGIETDSQICLMFDDGNHLEIEFSGDGPIILGFNTADFKAYPEYDGTCYTLDTLFGKCIGKTVMEVVFDKSDCKMEFPCYCGINMSEDDDGIKRIEFLLEDNTYLRASGVIDWFEFEHCTANGEMVNIVPYRDLLNELNEETLNSIFEE